MLVTCSSSALGQAAVDIDQQTTSTLRQKEIAAKVVAGARLQLAHKVRYKETYEKIAYPLGDVNAKYGVCTDLVVRAFRNAGIDLQKLLHEDRAAHPEKYPTHIWKYKKPDKNIDHRRCQNLVVFFQRFAESIDKKDYAQWRVGDVVFFIRAKQQYPWHVGIVSEKRTQGEMPKMLHLYPPRAREDSVDKYGPVHSVFRWPKR